MPMLHNDLQVDPQCTQINDAWHSILLKNVFLLHIEIQNYSSQVSQSDMINVTI